MMLMDMWHRFETPSEISDLRSPPSTEGVSHAQRGSDERGVGTSTALRLAFVFVVALAIPTLLWGQSADPGPNTTPLPQIEPRAVNLDGIHQASQLTDALYCGSEPEGKLGLESLKQQGIKTIISVDGAAPDAETARLLGMRYVHLPIGYDGIEPDEGLRIAKAIQELPKPIYLHCHHGLHRAPAAAAFGLVSLGQCTAAQAGELIKKLGTSPRYDGLYGAVENAKPVTRQTLADMPSDFPERAKLPSLAECMVQVGHTFDHLKKLRASGWNPTPNHPDLDPKNEAVILAEAFRELTRDEPMAQRTAEFRELLSACETAAWKLADESTPASKDAAFQSLSANCDACHTAYRD